MKALILASLLLVPSAHGISAKQQQDNDLAFQKEDDDLKVKIALITAGVTVMLIWLRGKGDDAAAFDKMMLEILFK